MRRLAVKSGALAVGLLVTSLLAWILLGWGPPGAGSGGGEAHSGMILARPALAQVAGQTFLEEEAGITAYVNLARTIDLAAVKSRFRTLERETSDYVVGSVALPGYDSSHDIHAFVTRSGWVAGYYSRAEPTSKIVDTASYTPGGSAIPTKLILGLTQLGLGVASSNLTYYHFGQPSANRMQIIADASLFYITIPSAFAVYEASIATRLVYFAGSINADLLSSDTRHQIYTSAGYWYIDGLLIAYADYYPLALVLVYSEP
ncbi:MAG: hypothetical protein Q7T05_00755 [Dehalococcoidia bacterium]|nr:hypothetical protein [Dehalococcoidia bacterium]